MLCIFSDILFELGNAINTELQLLKYGKYKNADEFADTKEKIEFKTYLKVEEQILKLIQAKPEAINNLIKQLNTSDSYEDLLEEAQANANWTFEEYTKSPQYVEHRNKYIKDWYAILNFNTYFRGTGPNALSDALKANDKELIKIILNNSILKINGKSLICNIGDLEIVDMFLERVEKIDIWSGFDQSWKKWNKDILNKVLESSKNVVNENYLRTVLDNGNSETIDSVFKRSSIKEAAEKLFSRALEAGYLEYIEKLTPCMPQKNEYMEIANNTGDPKVIEIISKHLHSLLDVSVELHQESSLIQVDINDHVTEIPLMGDQS